MRHVLTFLIGLLASPAFAEDTALLLGVERYQSLDRVRNAEGIARAETRLENLGFGVLSQMRPNVEEARRLATSFQQDVQDLDRLVVALSGHFVTDGRRSWLLTAEAQAASVFQVEEAAISIESLLHVLSNHPGRAVLLLGVASDVEAVAEGGGLRPGLGALDVPQGVTVLHTTPRRAAALLNTDLTEPNAQIGARLLSDPALTVMGYLPSDWVLMPGEVLLDGPEANIVQGRGPSEAELNAEAALWDRSTAADTIEAYRSYIVRFPEGRFVADAENKIAEILAEPHRDARLAEEALGLTRSARREIQADLTLLDYNTRGVDGIFGSGSRGAIMNWQQENGFPQTSYLTADQISMLDAQASRRQAEIDAEAARVLAAEQQRDRAYWNETGAAGDEPGFRAYLDRYPDGIFAQIATARLQEIESRRRSEAEAIDRAAWSVAQSEDSVEGYQNYLAAFPDGVFSAEARARIDALNTPQISNMDLARAQEEEANLRLSGVRAQLLELRLRDLGFDPGRLDGVIDQDSRRAIAAYQSSQGLAATGYVDTQTAVGLMTGSISITIPSR